MAQPALRGLRILFFEKPTAAGLLLTAPAARRGR